MVSSDLRQHLRALEAELQTLTTRNSRERLLQLLSPDFREFGRSGGSFDLAKIVSSLTSETTATRTTIDDFDIALLGETIALATYLGVGFHDDGSARKTNRSSIWRLEADGNWRMVFHQGTPTA